MTPIPATSFVLPKKVLFCIAPYFLLLVTFAYFWTPDTNTSNFLANLYGHNTTIISVSVILKKYTQARSLVVLLLVPKK